MIYSTAMQTANCIKCCECKAESDFFMDKRLGKRRTVCKACFRLANRRRTPEQRAKYRRKYGNVATDVEYVPREVQHQNAAQRTTEIERARALRAITSKQPKYDAHIKTWRAYMDGVEYASRYNNDPQFAAMERLRTQIRKKMKLHPKLDDLLRDAVNRNGSSNTVESVCGFTIAEFVQHFERLFTQGMGWDAFSRGEIHIDHVIPQAAFDMNDLAQVRECWSLKNLQPLWAADNVRKSDRTPSGIGKGTWNRLRHRGHCARAMLV